MAVKVKGSDFSIAALTGATAGQAPLYSVADYR
jgi:hypothetical protein